MGGPGTDPLISLLDDPDHGVYAVRALAGMGEAAFPKLVLTVTGGGETASRHAALALSRSGTAAVPVLVTALGTATGEGRDRVSRALVTGGMEYLPGIVSWLKEHPDDEVKSGELILVVMEVVGDDRERQLSLLGSGCPLLIAAASTVLATRGEEVVPDLMGLLGSEDQLARAGALSTLGAIGPPAVPALAGAVSDPVTPTGIRTGALAALGTIPGEESMKGIVGAVSDRDVAVRRAAVRAMPATGPAAPFLARSLRDNDEEVRQMAAERLGGLGRPGIVPLTNALEDRDPGIRKAAVAGLAALGMPARYLLSRALHDPDTGVRLKAARAFREAGMTPEYSYDAFSYRSLLAGEKDLPVRG
jgi:HEAT repeat protein